MKTTKVQLEVTIAGLLEAYDEGRLLTSEEFNLFVKGWTAIISRAADKYVEGKKKYKSDFLEDCDHLAEMDAELIDLVHYKFGADHNNKKVTML